MDKRRKASGISGGIFLIGLGVLLGTTDVNKLKASTVGAFIYLQPVIAGLFAIIMGADRIDALKIFAMVLIFSGVYLVSIKLKKLS